MKKYILVLLLGLFIAPYAQAALTVPKAHTLQPLPQDTGTNLQNNINSEDSPINQSLRSEQQQIHESLAPQNQPEVPDPEITPGAEGMNLTSGSTIWTYWILLIFGVLGMIGIIGYVSYRAQKRPR